MADPIQHATLVVCVLDLFHLDDLGLFQDLHSIEAVVVVRLHQVHATEAPRSQGALQLEVLLGVLPLGYSLLLVSLVALALGLTVCMRLIGTAGIRVYDVVDTSGIRLARMLGRGMGCGLHGCA